MTSTKILLIVLFVSGFISALALIARLGSSHTVYPRVKTRTREEDAFSLICQILFSVWIYICYHSFD